jgi:hypothetical protein
MTEDISTPDVTFEFSFRRKRDCKSLSQLAHPAFTNVMASDLIAGAGVTEANYQSNGRHEPQWICSSQTH